MLLILAPLPPRELPDPHWVARGVKLAVALKLIPADVPEDYPPGMALAFATGAARWEAESSDDPKAHRIARILKRCRRPRKPGITAVLSVLGRELELAS